jgi:hypothetical protein
MAEEIEVFSIPRHSGVPAPSSEQILSAPELFRVRTYYGNTFIITKAGLALLNVPLDAQTWAGVAIASLSAGFASQLGADELVKKLVEKVGERVGENLKEEGMLPKRVQASLRRSGSFAAGFAEVTRVAYRPDTWLKVGRLIVDVTRAGDRKTYTIEFPEQIKPEHIKWAANCIAQNRVNSEGAWSMIYAALRPSAPPTGAALAAVLSTESIADSLSDLAIAAGYTDRFTFKRRAMELHPALAEFGKHTATTEAYEFYRPET